MRIVALVAVLTVVVVAFAGCSAKPKGGASSSSTTSSHASSSSSSSSHSSTSSSGTSSSSSSSTGPSTPMNHAPIGSISAFGNGTVAAFNLTGTDSDGDALAWTLTFGDSKSANGTTLPATVHHDYGAVGNYSASFVLTDGKDPVSYNVTVALAAATGGAPSFVFSGAVKVNCSAQCESCDPAGGAVGCAPGVPVIGNPVLGAFGCASLNSHAAATQQGVDCIFADLPAGLVGKAFTATSTGGDPDLDFMDICDPVDGVNTQSSWNSGPEAGVVPDGFGCVVLWEFNVVTPNAPSTITFTVA